MNVRFVCPGCEQQRLAVDVTPGTPLQCPACAWEKAVPASSIVDDAPCECLVCGCDDLWRQKDFPEQLGLLMVGIEIVLSTIAWALYQPAIYIGVLLFFAMLDMLLYAFMKDVLVCYRCQARHRNTRLRDDHPRFNLETAERYRQEAARLSQSTQSAVSPSAELSGSAPAANS
jgi:hypothetical protein